MDGPRAWHRLFGMSWTDFFVGQPVIVEREKDLSQKQHLLEVGPIDLFVNIATTRTR